MKPTEMELRVAKEIYVRRTKANPESVAEHFHWYEEYRRDPASMVHASTVAHAIEDARAAIRAMREPTDDMRRAFNDAKYDIVYTETDYDGGWYAALCDDAADCAMRAMIDAASPSSERETSANQVGVVPE